MLECILKSPKGFTEIIKKAFIQDGIFSKIASGMLQKIMIWLIQQGFQFQEISSNQCVRIEDQSCFGMHEEFLWG